MRDRTVDERSFQPLSRRRVLTALLGVGALVFAPVRALARTCRAAVAADEGPFYPLEPFPETEDLIEGSVPGQMLYLFGRVMSRDCAPVPGAVVEIWQCDAGGQYRHPRAPKTKALEPGFRYFASTRAAADGTFRFRTLRPAPYEVFGLRRAPHIHVRVKQGGAEKLTTEIYFRGNEDAQLQNGDRVFQGRGPRKGEMVVDLQPASRFAARLPNGAASGALACEYDLTLG